MASAASVLSLKSPQLYGIDILNYIFNVNLHGKFIVKIGQVKVLYTYNTYDRQYNKYLVNKK